MDIDRELDFFANDSKSLRHSREDVLGEASLVFDDQRQRLSGALTNLSAGGVGVKLASAAAPLVKKGEKVQVQVRFPDGESVQADARVAWTTSDSKDGRLFGLVFEPLDEAVEDVIHRRLIAQVVSRHIDEDPS